jgi:hypothetical protein
MNSRTLAARPSDPSTISFAAHCFVQDGVQVVWMVAPTGNPTCFAGGARECDTEEQAAALARKLNRSYYRTERAIWKRVSWR